LLRAVKKDGGVERGGEGGGEEHAGGKPVSGEGEEGVVHDLADREGDAGSEGEFGTCEPGGEEERDQHGEQHPVADFTLGEVAHDQDEAGDDGDRIERPARNERDHGRPGEAPIDEGNQDDIGEGEKEEFSARLWEVVRICRHVAAPHKSGSV